MSASPWRGIAASVLLASCGASYWSATVEAGEPAANLWRTPTAPSAMLPAAEVFRVLPLLETPPNGGMAATATQAADQAAATHYTLEWDIAPGYYLYRDRIKVSAQGVAGDHAVLTAKALLPAGAPYHDAHFGDVQIYRGDVVASVAIPAAARRLHVRFQGCADQGICYPPQDVELEVPVPKSPR